MFYLWDNKNSMAQMTNNQVIRFKCLKFYIYFYLKNFNLGIEVEKIVREVYKYMCVGCLYIIVYNIQVWKLFKQILQRKGLMQMFIVILFVI